ncbi:MAG: helicase-associated domain-containing protein [Polyangiales bacterium]
MIVDRRGPRDTVIGVAALAHFTMRHTQSGPHRTDLKKLAATLAVSPAWLGVLLHDAIDSGVFGVANKILVPRLSVLRSIAEGKRHARDRWSADLRTLEGWVPFETTRRIAVARQNFDVLGGFMEPGTDDVFEHTTVEGVLLARKPRLSPQGTGDGHVTPSFEVFLGPGADLGVTLHVALCAEPTRVDTIATFKLTPKSVANAALLGLTIDDVLAALARVGPHGIPANVQDTVRDWVSTTASATVRPVYAVECPTADAADRAARALGKSVLQRPTPTLLLVDADPHVKLAKAGVGVSSEVVPLVPDDDDGGHDWPRAPLLHAKPDPTLRERFLRDERTTSSEALDPETESVRGMLSGLPEFLRAQVDHARSRVVGQALLRLAQLWEKAAPELIAWALQREEPVRAVKECVESPFAMAHFLTLDPTRKARVLEAARDAEELVSRARTLRPHVTGELGKLLKKDAVASYAEAFRVTLR